MSLTNFRSSLRPKLNSSFNNEQEADPNSLIQEIRQLKENFDSLRTPKLYQKIVSQYKANLKNKRLADAITAKDKPVKNELYGSIDVLRALKESNKPNGSIHGQSSRYDDESTQSIKENHKEECGKRVEAKSMSDLAIQTTPRNVIPMEELAKLQEEYNNQIRAAKVMEEDLSKIRIENIKLDKALKNAQENLAVLGKNQNNTSSSFSLPSEFKANWELLAKDQIINVFSDFIDNPIIVTNLIQEIIMICYDQVKNVIKEINCSLLKILNLNEKSEAEIKKHLANFYQDNHSSIFKLDENRLEKIKSHYKKNVDKIFTHTYTDEFANFPPDPEETGTENKDSVQNEKENKDTLPDGESSKNNEKEAEEQVGVENTEKQEFKVEIREEYPEQFDEMLEMEDFSKFVHSVFYLCLFMLLNDPPLRVPIDNFKNRKFIYRKFKKNDFICVDGFAKENSPCLVLLPAVARNNYSYNGIKPSVLILQEEFLTPRIMKALEEHEKEEQEKLAKKLLKEAQEEKIIHSERAPLVKGINISIDNKYYAQSLNTTNLGEQQNTSNISRSNSIMLHNESGDASKSNDKIGKDEKSQDHSSLTASRNTKLEATAKLLDDSKDHDENIAGDVTVKPVKMSNPEALLQREDIEDGVHNQTIPIFLTERNQRTNDENAEGEMTPQQTSNSSRDLSRPKKYPLPTYHFENASKSLHDNIQRSLKGQQPRPLSVRANEQERGDIKDSLRNKITDIYDILKNSGMKEKDSKAVRSSFCSEMAFRNLDAHHQINFQHFEESKDYSLNSYPTQRTSRTSVLNNHAGYHYKATLNDLSSSRADSSNARVYIEHNNENYYDKDNSYARDSHNRSIERYKVDDLREKIRKSFQSARNKLNGDSSSVLKGNDSNDLLYKRQVQGDMPSKAASELNTTISSLRQSIELLKNAKTQNDKIRSKVNDPYEKLSTSLVVKHMGQAEKFTGSVLKHLENENSRVEASSGKKGDGIVSKIVAERIKSLEKSHSKNYERDVMYSRDETTRKEEGEKSPKILSHEYIKQKLSKINMNTRSISTNRPGYIGKIEEDNLLSGNESFRKDISAVKGLNRIGSVTKLNQKIDRHSAKENEENQQIFRALRNIYQKN